MPYTFIGTMSRSSGDKIPIIIQRHDDWVVIRQILAVMFDEACIYERFVNSSRNNKMVNETKTIHDKVIREIYATFLVQCR